MNELVDLTTDAPWCSITSTSAAFPLLPSPGSELLLAKVGKPEKFKLDHGVKGRMEPCEVGIIAHVVARIKGVSMEEIAEAAWENTLRLFYPER